MLLSELEEAFLIFKSSFEDIISKSFGWNEEFQRNRFFTKYQIDWFRWIEVDSERIGYICYWQSDIEIHISLIILFPEKQRHSYGKQLMFDMKKHAQLDGRKITLSTFKQNEGAIRFYENLG